MLVPHILYNIIGRVNSPPTLNFISKERRKDVGVWLRLSVTLSRKISKLLLQLFSYTAYRVGDLIHAYLSPKGRVIYDPKTSLGPIAIPLINKINFFIMKEKKPRN
jgi:hypothetical protein